MPPTTIQTSHDPLISEIRMLLDFVTGSPLQTLRDLVIPDPDHPPAGDKPADAAPITLRNAAILNRLNDLETKVTTGGTVTSTDRTFLQLLRDALGTMVRPATGLTIAYTSMVVGRQRGRYSHSRSMRAEQAYASLAGPATRHRWAQRILLALAVAITSFAVWESAHVAFGRSLLQSVQALQVQQVAIAQDMTKLLDASRPPTTSAPIMIGGIALPAAPILRLCDRPRVLAFALRQQGQTGPRMGELESATLFESPAQQALCDRDIILAAKFAIAHDGLLSFQSDWTSVLRSGDSLPARLLDILITRDPGPPGDPPGAPPCTPAAAPAVTNAASLCPSTTTATTTNRHDPAPSPVHFAAQADVDFAIAPVLLILGNYVLPIVFALLGATVYVILDFYSKVRDSLLAPRDAILSWIRLVLGMVLGACVGLFFSTANPGLSAPAGAALADSITLSASGLAFIAGFGVEGVFGMLDSLVRRIFSGDQDKATHLAPQ